MNMPRKYPSHPCKGCMNLTTNKTFCSISCRETRVKIVEIKVCPKCGTEHSKHGTFCSRTCSNSRSWSKNDKLKKSIAAKNSLRVRKANRENNIQRRKRPYVERACPICLSIFSIRDDAPRIFCSMACYRSDTKFEYRKKPPGGYRKGACKSKAGWYKGIFCDSTWELAYVIYCLEHDMKIARNTKTYEYEFKNKKRTYLPDFIVDGDLVEIKGYITEQWKAKLRQFKLPLTVLYAKEMQPIFDYVITKYGNDYKSMYIGNPHNEKNNKCLECGNPARNLYCSRSCSLRVNRRKRKSRSSNS